MLTSCRYETRNINQADKIHAIYNDYPYVCSCNCNLLRKKDIYIVKKSIPEHIKTKKSIDIDYGFQYSDYQLYIHKSTLLKKNIKLNQYKTKLKINKSDSKEKKIIINDFEEKPFKYNAKKPTLLNLTIYYPNNIYLTAYSSKAKTAIFDYNKSLVSIKENLGCCKLTITYNDTIISPTEWKSIEIINKNTPQASIKPLYCQGALGSEDDFIYTAKNFKKVYIITNYFENHKKEKIKITTKYKKFFIYENDKRKISVKIDSNGNGKFDKEIPNT